MAPIPETPELAMPIGLPAKGVDPATHYANLAANLAAEVNASGGVTIWVADNPQFSAVHTMARAAVRYFPAGTVLATNTLLCKTWLWESLSLKRSAGFGTPLLAAIQLGNLNQAAITVLVQDELNTNPGYAGRPASARAQMGADFVAGNLTLLVTAGIPLARGDVDAAPPRAELSGYRRTDVTFIGSDGVTLEPYAYFEMWRSIGGVMVTGHPLLGLVRRDVWPGSAPVEGGTRVRIEGQDFTADTAVTVGGAPATDPRVSDNGSLLHVTLPPGATGAADVVVSTPGRQGRTIRGGIRYVTDVIETARATSAGFSVHLTEMLRRAQSLAAAGTLGAAERSDLRLELEFAHRLSYQAIDDRAIAESAPANSPGVIDAVALNETEQRSLLAQLIDLLG